MPRTIQTGSLLPSESVTASTRMLSAAASLAGRLQASLEGMGAVSGALVVSSYVAGVATAFMTGRLISRSLVALSDHTLPRSAVSPLKEGLR